MKRWNQAVAMDVVGRPRVQSPRKKMKKLFETSSVSLAGKSTVPTAWNTRRLRPSTRRRPKTGSEWALHGLLTTDGVPNRLEARDTRALLGGANIGVPAGNPRAIDVGRRLARRRRALILGQDLQVDDIVDTRLCQENAILHVRHPACSFRSDRVVSRVNPDRRRQV